MGDFGCCHENLRLSTFFSATLKEQIFSQAPTSWEAMLVGDPPPDEVILSILYKVGGTVVSSCAVSVEEPSGVTLGALPEAAMLHRGRVREAASAVTTKDASVSPLDNITFLGKSDIRIGASIFPTDKEWKQNPASDIAGHRKVQQFRRQRQIEGRDSRT